MTIEDQLKSDPNLQYIEGVVVKSEVVGSSTSGGYYVDLTLESGVVIETTIQADKYEDVKNKMLEFALFLVKPIGDKRYESNCIIFAKTPEHIH